MKDWKSLLPQDKIYYETEHGILYCADALEILPQIPDEFVDLIHTDPPYNISQEKKIIKSKMFPKVLTVRLDYGEWDRQWETSQDYFNWLEQFILQFERIIKPGRWLYVWLSKEGAAWLSHQITCQRYPFVLKTWLIWAKTNPPPQVFNINWSSGFEVCVAFGKDKVRFRNPTRHSECVNIYYSSVNRNTYENGHPNSKPINFISKILYVSSRDNEIVLDCFAGGGSTIIAAEKMERRWIGIELEETYCQLIKNKLIALQQQQYLPLINNDIKPTLPPTQSLFSINNIGELQNEPNNTTTT